MTNRPILCALVVLLFPGLSCGLDAPLAAAGPRVDIVVGERPPALEQQAAEDLAAGLKSLFDADVHIGPQPPARGIVLFVGSPTTSAALKLAAGDTWPQLSDQGHVVRSIPRNGGAALVVGGGSPVATRWAVDELCHHWGIRALLPGDFPPLETPEFQLDGFDMVLEPAVRTRAWRIFDDSPTGFGAWGAEDLRSLIGQLSHLKFNRIVLRLTPTQPFFPESERPTCALFGGASFPVSGDTPGRSVFKGAKFFGNPDLDNGATRAELLASGASFLAGVSDFAHELGMSVGVEVCPADFGDEAGVAVQAALKACPTLDALYLDMAESGDPLRLRLDQIDAELPADRRPEVQIITTASARGSIIVPEGMGIVLRSVPDEGGDPPPAAEAETLRIALRNEKVGVLPDLGMAGVSKAVAAIRDGRIPGLLVTCEAPGDLNPAAYFVARSCFEAGLTFDQAVGDLIGPVCGAGVVDRVKQGFTLVDEASALIEEHRPGLGVADPEMVLSLYRTAGETPSVEWLEQVRTRYTDAMNEMYRANTRARGGARPLTLYYAKKFEFGMSYIMGLEAAHRAGLAAEGSEDRATELAAAAEAIYGALTALGEVARDPSDRGVIALLSEYGYRPLLKELEAAE